MRQDTFDLHQNYEQLYFLQKIESLFHWLFPQKLGSRSLSTIGEKLEHFNQSLTKFVSATSVTSLRCYAKKIENLKFVLGVNFEFIDSLKNNGPRYLLVFDDSCEEICNSNAFVDIATPGRHWALSTIYIKHNLFHQSRLGRDVKLQNTQIAHSSLPVT